MQNINEKTIAYTRVFLIVAIWTAVLFFHKIDFSINLDSLKRLPEVVTIYLVISLIFRTFLWKIKLFHPWLIPYPYLQGTWEGTLQSTWINPETGKEIPPIKMILVIKQSFSKISCVMFTKESESNSTAAQIYEEDGSGILRLSYNYTNKPQASFHNRSQIHDGAASLKIVMLSNKKLEGMYWTSRKTTGDISLSFKSRKLVQNFS